MSIDLRHGTGCAIAWWFWEVRNREVACLLFWHFFRGTSLYRLQGIAGAEPLYRVVTTILEPERAPAAELAAVYHERWELETALDELKTHLRGAKIVLRSKTPDLVRQEFYGLLLTHFAIRKLMHEAALQAKEDADHLSFLHTVRIARRKFPHYGAIPPSGEKSPA